jgi:hypothetical protein
VALRFGVMRRRVTRTFAPVEAALREAVRRGRVSHDVRGGYPRYAWGWFRGRLYKAMLINQESGWYKAWPIEPLEALEDEQGRLAPEASK